MTPDATVAEPGSFRDRNARVFYQNGRVLRALSAEALVGWQNLTVSDFYKRFNAREQLVGTKVADDAEPLAASLAGDWATVLEHDPIPFVSYPYEWPFGMLKASALLQLDLLLSALDEGMVLIDGSAYNVQFRGASPVFIDIPSIREARPGEPWAGYRQFCQLLLYPLMLRAYKRVDYFAWLRGCVDGITPTECNELMSFRDLLRRGVFSHVFLHSKLEQRYAATDRRVGQELRDSGFNVELIKANARGLRRLVSSLAWRQAQSEWSSYTTGRSYSKEGLEQKRAFVREALGSGEWELAWDLGCNTGEFSLLAAERARNVVAMDADHLTVELLYRKLSKDGPANILPIVNNIADPSPGIGWKGTERKTLVERGQPDMVLGLALIHHIVLGANIPTAEFVDWLADTTSRAVVVEFVNRNDPMVAVLLRNKEDRFADYDPTYFERCLRDRFEIQKRVEIDDGKRTLYHGVKRSAP